MTIKNYTKTIKFKKTSHFINQIHQSESNNFQMLIPKMQNDCRMQILNRNHFSVQERIGKGAFGEVFTALSTLSNQIVAIKVIQRTQNDSVKYLYQEINAMRIISHPNTTKLIKSFSQNQYFFIVMEYCNYGSLQNYLQAQPNKRVQTKKAISILVQILKGLFAIHSKYILHRDLKLQNILLHKEPGQEKILVKISDFGLSTQTGYAEAETTCGTDKYMAPEILEGDRYGFQVDLWAVGIILFRLLFHKFPFIGSNKKYIMRDIILKSERLNFVESYLLEGEQVDQKVVDFFTRVFVINVDKRIKFHELLNLSLFSQYKNQLGQMTVFYSEYYKDKETCESQGLTMKIDDELEIVNAKLNNFNQAIRHQIKKYDFLKQIAIKLHKNLKQYLSRTEESKITYHLIKASIFFSSELLKYLEAFLLPPSLKRKISKPDWDFCVKTPIYSKYCRLLKNEVEKAYKVYDQVYLKLQQEVCYSMKEEKFQQFKHQYREAILETLNLLTKRKRKEIKQLAEIRLQLFCCFMINRIFDENARQSFPFFVNWGRKKSVFFPQKFCFERFKKWIKQEQTWRIQLTFEMLKLKYF